MAYTRKHKTKICRYTGQDPKRIFEISITQELNASGYKIDDIMFVAYTDYETFKSSHFAPIPYIFILDKLDYSVIDMMCPGKEILNQMFESIGICTNRKFNRYLVRKVRENAIKRGYIMI